MNSGGLKFPQVLMPKKNNIVVKLINDRFIYKNKPRV